MGHGVQVRFSGGQVHLPGGARYPAQLTVKGKRDFDGSSPALPEGFYDFDPMTGQMTMSRPGLLTHGRRGQAFDLHTGYWGNGIRVGPAAKSHMESLRRHPRSRGQLGVLVHYGNRAPWIATARDEIGTSETGTTNLSSRIRTYWREIGQGGLAKDRYDPETDEKINGAAWCGGFVAWVMLKHNESYANQGSVALTENPAGSQNWTAFGTAQNEPTFGSICIQHSGSDRIIRLDDPEKQTLRLWAFCRAPNGRLAHLSLYEIYNGPGGLDLLRERLALAGDWQGDDRCPKDWNVADWYDRGGSVQE